MKMTCLGSGSAGNCYLLHNQTECLVIEAGISFKEVKKALDFDISKIVGTVVSHNHKDHAGYIKEYLKAGIGVFTTQDLLDECFKIEAAGLLSEKCSFYMGEFFITPFEAVHDVECYGFIIRHKEMGRLLFATDTEYIRYRFKELDHIMIECNYSQKLLPANYHRDLQERIRLTHMELETCKDFIRQNKNDTLKSVCLMHLSDRCSDEVLFQAEVQGLVDCPVYVADKGSEYLL